MNVEYLALAEMYGYYWNAVGRKDEDSARKLYIAISRLEEKLEPEMLARTHLDISYVCAEAGDVPASAEHLYMAYEYMAKLGKHEMLVKILDRANIKLDLLAQRDKILFQAKNSERYVN